jgi:hypothetical protein
MIITKMALPRRTFLRGVGVTLALPLLDAMVPALSTMVSAAKPVRRYGFFYMPNGVAMNHTGVNYWKPTTVGADFEFSQILKPLEPFRNQVTVVSGLHNRSAESLGDGNGDHTRSTGSWLTGTHIKRTEGSDLRAGISIDQIIAAQFKKETALPSLELAILPNSVTGGCDTGYSCAYGTTLAWASPTTPLPTQSSPRLVFEQLFGDGGPASQQIEAARTKNSLLDSAIQEIAGLQAKLGPADRSTVSDYLEVLREVERRIQQTEEKNALSPLPAYDRPGIGVPERFDEHAKLMFDLQVLAFATEVTRVSSFKMGRDVSARVFPDSGVSTPFHALSHHGDKSATIEEFARLNKYHVGVAAYFLDKLKNTPDGDGSLLDHTLVLYGSPMADGNRHSHKRLPLFLAGHANGQLKGNQHFKAPLGTPMGNALLTVLHKLGVDDVDHIGDSTGVLPI